MAILVIFVQNGAGEFVDLFVVILMLYVEQKAEMDYIVLGAGGVLPQILLTL